MATHEATLLASGSRTTTQTVEPSSSSVLLNGMGDIAFLEAVLDMTVVGTGSVTLSIEGYDEAAAAFKTILASAAIVTNITTAILLGPGAPSVANVSSPRIVPKRWRVVATANNANAATYSVSARVVRA